MFFIVEVRPVEAGAEVRGACDVVDGEEVFERAYEVVLGRLLRSLVAQAEHAQAEHVWTWADHDE